jgi:hypothetical protein
MSTTPQEPVEDLKGFVGKCREAAEYLRLIQHCRNCNGTCSHVTVCNSTKELLLHLPVCQEPCSKRGCKQTKKILEHYQSCKASRQQAFLTGSPHKFCLICSLAVRDEGHTKSPSQSMNYENRECVTTSRPRKSSDTDFEIPLLPKRFREFGSGCSSMSSSGGIASMDIASQGHGSASSSSASGFVPARIRSISSPVDIATRLSTASTLIEKDTGKMSAGNSPGSPTLPVARYILGGYQEDANSSTSPRTVGTAGAVAVAMETESTGDALKKTWGTDVQLYGPDAGSTVVVVVAEEEEDSDDEDDGHVEESEFLYASANANALTRLMGPPSGECSPRSRRLSL